METQLIILQWCFHIQFYESLFTTIPSINKTAYRNVFDFMNLTIHINKSPGIDQIPAELIKAGCRTIRSETHKLINSIWKKEKLPESWKKSIILPIFRKGDKTNCSNYRRIKRSKQHNSVKVNTICRGDYWDHQCGFRRNRSTTDHIFCIRQILKKKIGIQ